MANIIPANYPRPDPGDAMAGEPIIEPVGQDLLDASNYFAAAPALRVSQGWDASDDPHTRVALFPVMPAVGSLGAHVAVWPVPAYGVRTDLEVLAYGRRDGAAGNIRFRSVATGDTATLALPGANGYTSVGTLTVDCSGGVDYVEIYLEGDGVDPSHVFYVYGDFPLLTGALPVPTVADEPTPLDEDELAADEPWSSDVSLALLDNLALFLAWNSVYFTWSGLQNTSSGSKASYSLPEWDHQVVTSVHRGQLRRELEWTARARVANVGGGSEGIVVRIGAQTGGEPDVIDVPGGAGAKTVSATFQPTDLGPDGREAREVAGVEHPMAFLTFDGDRAISTAELRSISVWGV